MAFSLAGSMYEMVQNCRQNVNDADDIVPT
jgi:hypothetical protein